MDGFMNEMAIWNGMSSAFISNAIFFAACAFLIWVGFRFTSRIYYDGDVNLLGKIFTTLFCLSIALFTLGTMVQGQNIAFGYANAFSALYFGVNDLLRAEDGVISNLTESKRQIFIKFQYLI